MMPSLDIQLDGEGCWPDLDGLREGELIDAMGDETRIGLALLPGGMASGKPSVTIRVDLADGRVLIAETSFALLEAAVRAMRARIGS